MRKPSHDHKGVVHAQAPQAQGPPNARASEAELGGSRELPSLTLGARSGLDFRAPA